MYYGLALNYALLGLQDQAAYWIARMQRDYPEFWFRDYADSNIPMWRGDYGEAARVFRHALNKRGEDLAALSPFHSIRLGHYQALSGDYAGAVATLTSILPDSAGDDVLDRDSIGAYQDLAWSYLQLGEPAKARTLLQRVRERD